MLEALQSRIHRIQDRMSVARQMSIAMALVSLAGIAALAIVSASLSRTEMIRRITTDVTLSAQMVATQLDDEMFERYADIRQLATMSPLSTLWTGDPAAVRIALDQLRDALPTYAWIGFAAPDGTVIAATGSLLEGVSVAQRPWFTGALAGPFVGDVHEALLLAKHLGLSRTGEPMRFVDVAFPIRNAGGQLVGVLGAHLGFDWAEDLRRGALQGSQDKEIWVLGSDGAVLLGPRQATPLFAPERVAQMTRTKAGAFEEKRGGKDTLTAYAVADGKGDYPGLGWIVVAQQDASVAFAIPTRLGATILAIGMVVMLVSVLLTIWVSRRLSRPLAALTQAAGEIGRNPQVTMLPRLRGSLEVIQVSGSLRALIRRLGSVELRFEEHAQRYEEDLAALRRLADSDPLTGLMNRRSFLSVAETALQGTRSSDRLGILMGDIDHFKLVNDTYGHAAGDAVIRFVAATIAASLRLQDRVARFGGEEFVVLLLDVTEAETVALAERIRLAIAESPVMFEDHAIRVSMSFGVALVNRGDPDVDAVIERADFALYEAKTTGRNRVALANSVAKVA
ncbi:sensor domain-containing diguanylate cyclase [Aquabacter cavernae]|uniref:sensor domain-containing diguanylate cyclase n=1 Tax=Aquabacter cavernae TaxID=2496029 RepID=UPI000F8C903A|nr:sensor domain-containing diguanylate cyclase [Aquabacter cavernae]